MANRREFLRSSAGLSLFTASGMASMLNNFDALAADATGYKALVCVFLFGGMDHYDTLLPVDQTSYDSYAAVRQPLLDRYAAQRADHNRLRTNLLPLNPASAGRFGSRQFGMPAEMAAMHNLVESGNAAVVANVGPLLEPITRVEFRNDRSKRPRRLFSHNDQQSTWMAFQPEGARFGWGGLFADPFISAGANVNPIFTSISLAGDAVFLSGNQTRAYRISGGGARTVEALDRNRLRQNGRLSDRALSLMRDHFAATGVTRRNLFELDVAEQLERSVVANELFDASTQAAPTLTTAFPDTRLGSQLFQVARTISVRDALGARRQVFFVSLGGFDSHSNQANSLPGRQTEIAEAVSAFYNATVELGVDLDVTLFTASDFGRTFSINGDGSDHGWGAHHYVVGGAVNGGDIYGDIPPFELGHDYDAGNGRLIPTTSIEQYAATLGNWFGLSASEIDAALPNLSTFAQRNLGFI